MSKNYYEILSLKRDATAQQIAEGYRKNVLRWHPKFAKQDQKTSYYYFSEISEAYQVLSDPIKRAFYDKYGWEKLKQGLFAEGELKGGYRFANNPDQIFQKFFHSNNAFAKVFDKEITERGSIFSHAFGALHYQDSAKYQDLIVNVQCTLHQLYKGVAKQVVYQRKMLNPNGRTTTLFTQSKLLQIKPGFGKDTILTFKGQGHQSVHRTRTNLIFKIIELPHQKYSRINNDLIYTTQISLAEAIDCKALDIITLDHRKIRCSIDEIVNPKTLKQIIGEGMPILGKKQKGNLYVRFLIQFPIHLEQWKKAQLRKLLN